MQTCSSCNTRSQDTITECPNCHAVLKDFSMTAVVLKKFQSNPRVIAVRISPPAAACQVCQAARGTYQKYAVPSLPVDGCSEEQGCTCFYEPILDQIYP